MKRLLHSICVAGALLGLVATWPQPVQAQHAVAQGTFVLPFEVQWQGETLEPGEYHFRLPSAAFGRVISIRDAQGRTKLLAVTEMRDDSSGPSMLTIVERNGKRYVSSLAIKQLAAKLKYPIPSQKTEMGQPREASVQIPVRMTGR